MPLHREARGVKEILEAALRALPSEIRAEALTHVSYVNEKGSGQVANERLEFLGDAVLYLSTAHLLFDRYPAASEGDLTRTRASLVSGANLAEVAMAAGLGERLRLGRGEKQTGGSSRPRLLASALEAVIGAVYLSEGWDVASEFVGEMLLPRDPSVSGEEAARVPVDPKTLVQEKVQKSPGTTLEYQVLRVEGPDHSPVYTVACVVGGAAVSTGRGQTKKEAEEQAAAAFLESNPKA